MAVAVACYATASCVLDCVERLVPCFIQVVAVRGAGGG